MNNAIIKQFKDKGKLVTFVWKGKPAWIAKQVSELAGQVDKSASTYKFLKDNEFLEELIDYEIVRGQDLKELKKMIEQSSIILKGKAIIVFYESALWAYLQSLRTDMGKMLKQWINREILPSIRKNGVYICGDSYEQMTLLDEPNTETQIVEETKSNNIIEKNVEALKVALDTANMFNALIDETGLESNIKLIVAKELFEKIGINISLEMGIKTRTRKAKINIKYAVDDSKYKDIVDNMLINKVRYKDISEFLKSKGENISTSSIGRYAKHFFKDQQEKVMLSIISDNGGNSNE